MNPSAVDVHSKTTSKTTDVETSTQQKAITGNSRNCRIVVSFIADRAREIRQVIVVSFRQLLYRLLGAMQFKGKLLISQYIKAKHTASITYGTIFRRSSITYKL